jgi:uncharacterized protein YoxC
VLRSLKPGQLPVIALIVVLVWVVFAVAMLTGTLLSARNIDNQVVEINKVYPQVHKNLGAVPLAFETARVAGEIDKAAKPVGPAFTKVVEDVNGIQASVESILAAGGEINASVKSINAGVHSIDSVVVPIGQVLGEVKDDVDCINDSVHGIDHKFDKILDTSRDIRDQVKGINHRADIIIDTVKDIKDNTNLLVDKILPGILKNSTAIANSPVIHPLAPGSLAQIVQRLNPTRVLAVPSVPVLPSAKDALPGLLGKDTDAADDDDAPSQENHKTLPSLSGLLGG